MQRELLQLQSLTEDKKRLFTKMERRKFPPPPIKMSFSSKNYRRGNNENNGDVQH